MIAKGEKHGLTARANPSCTICNDVEAQHDAFNHRCEHGSPSDQLKIEESEKAKEYEVRDTISCRRLYFHNAEHPGFCEVRQRYRDR